MSDKRTYRVNEVFYSIQGEGVRAGTANIFVRFTGCNLQCRVEAGEKSPGGFDCDTEFASGRDVTPTELIEWMHTAEEIAGGTPQNCRNIIFTGGEPALQLDDYLLGGLRSVGYFTAIETNGSLNLAARKIDVDWITVSPKVAEHAIKQQEADEVKYVRGYGQAIPKTVVNAKHKLISPAFDGMVLHPRTLQWCMNLVMENPEWRLSIQQHKGIQVR